MKYSTNWLLSQIESGFKPEYLFFWGHTQKKEGDIDKSCLSQWFPSEFIVDGIRYLSAEHWMMAAKALMFNDNAMWEKIINSENPAVAKKLGREVRNFNRRLCPLPEWQKHSTIKDVLNLKELSRGRSIFELLHQPGHKVVIPYFSINFFSGSLNN